MYVGFICERIYQDLGKINFTYFLLEVALQKCLLPCKIHSYDIVTYPSALDFSPYPYATLVISAHSRVLWRG